MADVVPSAPSRMLVQLEAARRALAEARTVDVAKSIRDQAEAVRHYLRQQEYGTDMQNDAAELKLRAERRLGELLREMPKQRPGEYKRSDDRTVCPSLADRGINKRDAARWQKIADLPPETFEQHITEVRGTEGAELTTNGLLRVVRQTTRPTAPGGPFDSCTIDDLLALADSGKTFGTVYADPPWAYGNQATRASTDNHYKTMSVGDIATLPVRRLAAECSHLHLWTTNGFLREAFDVISAWGFVYKSLLVWDKDQMGIGNYWRVQTEFLLLGVRGGLTFAAHDLPNVLRAGRSGHSAKPEQARLMVERASPGPRLELFGRRAVEGWTVWGDQIERDLFHHGNGAG